MSLFRGVQGMNRQFTDTLQIGTKTGSDWGSAPVTDSWAYNTTSVVHGFVEQKTSEEVFVSRGISDVAADGSEATLTDATIYIPVDTTITNEQRLKLTHRDRALLGTAEVYAIIGTPQAARSCLVCNAKRVTGESRR